MKLKNVRGGVTQQKLLIRTGTLWPYAPFHENGEHEMRDEETAGIEKAPGSERENRLE